ncbi:dTDP-4-amino-4,6-dideoxy-D-glucose transaminase [Pilimelia anulata]|uniref:dTDP-4-amino-4,6-dideoxy-D-glucose transaminase n=1 Tax=Pilimelia anulata TaxID=53371 RepID=A0A8J3BEF1_9ACTN|nr:dTDP-4-amino-4,6-dideoxygalactose transaminase [Pilimelia anulata]GGK08673.1 dTDP-4-amino-4,6-dideoxy-D-glucose transaminase [Pilimelia anulata]
MVTLPGTAPAAAPPIPFHRPHHAARTQRYVTEALATGHTHGDGPFTRRAVDLLRPLVGGRPTLLTTSCTHALEMTALLLDLRPGDEVIMPSYTFVSTANAYALRGAVPVFVDCRPDTLNLDETRVEAAVTARTRAIVVVHYGGVACAMDTITAVADRHGLPVIEDNAHGLGGAHHGRPLGTLGAMATLSFHATKNVQCGEGGALVLADPALAERAEIIREKGTDRSRFFRGAVDKYRWRDLGSSYPPADLLAAVLTAQLEEFPAIQARRHHLWETYHAALADWAADRGVARPGVPAGAAHTAHLYQLLLPDPGRRAGLLAALAAAGIAATFHYQPLHTAPAGRRYGRTAPGGCPVTEDVADRIVRLPLHSAMTDAEQRRVVAAVRDWRP